MSGTPAARLQIGDWRVEPALGEISRGDEVVRLEARTLRLLLHLASRPGEVVSVDDLLDQVWPGVTVTPDSVYQAVASLRRQLGDDPRRPRYIANAPRLGYRMVAPVRELAATGPGSKLRRAGGAVLAAALLAAGAAAGWGVLNPAPPAPVTVGVMPFLDLTDGMGNEVLVDDMAEDVADQLARTRGLRCPAPRSIFQLKHKHLSLTEAARRLGVSYIVDGSVRGAPGAYRVTARLVRADNGFVIWSQAFAASGTDPAAPKIAAAAARQALSQRAGG
jgi:DNA-binding winged helix-turn-helix (wHTH) protein/TolB-like protein